MTPIPQTAFILLALAMAQPLAACEGDHDHAHASEAATDMHAEDDHDHAGGEHHEDDHDHEDGHDHAHGGDHVHDRVHMDVSISGRLVTVETELPGGNVFPEDMEEDDHTLQAATAIFDESGLGLMLPASAGCERVSYSVELDVITDGEHEGHSDARAKQIFLCEDMAGFDRLTITAFDAFIDVADVVLHADREGLSITAELDGTARSVPFALIAE